MSLIKRLKVLEAVANAQPIERVEWVVVSVAHDRSILQAYCHDESGKLVPVSEEELANIRLNAEANCQGASDSRTTA